jgi:hypothetical protein
MTVINRINTMRQFDKIITFKAIADRDVDNDELERFLNTALNEIANSSREGIRPEFPGSVTSLTDTIYRGFKVYDSSHYRKESNRSKRAVLLFAIRVLLCGIIAQLVVYAAVSFVNLELNAALWSPDQRVSYLVMSAMLFVVMLFITRTLNFFELMDY